MSVSVVLPDSGSRVGTDCLTSRDAQPQIPSVPTRICSTCYNPIPTARLKALPNAHQCVSCVMLAGDVAPIKRFDEASGDDTVQTYFTDCHALDIQIGRTTVHVPSAKVLADSTEAPIETRPYEINKETEQSDREILDSQQLLA